MGLRKGLIRSCSVAISSFLPLMAVAICIKLASSWDTSDVGKFAAFVFYCEDITKNCENFALKYTQIITSVADLKRILEVWGEGIDGGSRGLAVRSPRCWLL